MKSIKRIEAENPAARVICTHIFVTMVKNNPNRYNMPLNALGVVPISKSLFFICGGYERRKY